MTYASHSRSVATVVIRYSYTVSHMYRVGQKNLATDILPLLITALNTDRFSKYFFTGTLNNKVIIKDPTTPQTLRCTTL